MVVYHLLTPGFELEQVSMCCLGFTECMCCLVVWCCLQDLKESLAELGSLSPDLIVAVELLWTPQERGDSYSKDELLIDYPNLMNL